MRPQVDQTGFGLIATGAFGRLHLSDEARAYSDERGAAVEAMPTGEAIDRWNAIEEPAIGLFHVTC